MVVNSLAYRPSQEASSNAFIGNYIFGTYILKSWERHTKQTKEDAPEKVLQKEYTGGPDFP